MKKNSKAMLAATAVAALAIALTLPATVLAEETAPIVDAEFLEQCPACGEYFAQSATHACADGAAEDECGGCPVCGGMLMDWDTEDCGGFKCSECGWQTECWHPDYEEEPRAGVDGGEKAGGEPAEPNPAGGSDGGKEIVTPSAGGSTTQATQPTKPAAPKPAAPKTKTPVKRSTRKVLPFTGGNEWVLVVLGGLFMGTATAIALKPCTAEND